MIPTSTNVQIQLKDALPASMEATVALIHKEVGPEAANAGLLTPPQRAALDNLLKAKAVTGKSNEVVTHLLDDQRRLIVIGLGNAARFSVECLREAGATLAKTARKHKLHRLALVVPKLPATLPGVPDAPSAGEAVPLAIEALATGFALGAFDFREFKGAAGKKTDNTQPADNKPLHLTIVLEDSASARPALQRGLAIAEGQNFARTIASRPGNAVNPPVLARIAQQAAREAGLTIRVLDDRQMQKLGMGGLLAVGGGSTLTPPRLIAIEYKPAGRQKGAGAGAKADRNRPLMVVGKGITFDTGGISIKPAEKMGRMIYDKSGSLVVLGTMLAVARLKPPVPVVGLLACAENHISESAYRPGDVLRMYNGVTVEVTNTDAEGRLVLGDALSWGIETYRPAAVVDLATLTGAIVIALGKTMAGAMGNDDALIEQLKSAAMRAGERFWRMPIGDEHREQLKSESADIINSAGREASSLTAAAFLSHFVPEGTPWAHLDIAGVADSEKDHVLYGKGATAWGVRTLVEWIMSRAEAR